MIDVHSATSLLLKYVKYYLFVVLTTVCEILPEFVNVMFLFCFCSKIQQYSPSEAVKVYEKTASRRSNAQFNPKGTINKLKQGNPPEFLDEEGRKDLIRQYLDVSNNSFRLLVDHNVICCYFILFWTCFLCFFCFQFKQLMLQLDPDDLDEDENKVLTALSGGTNTVMNPNATGAATSVLTEADQVALANYKVQYINHLFLDLGNQKNLLHLFLRFIEI